MILCDIYTTSISEQLPDIWQWAMYRRLMCEQTGVAVVTQPLPAPAPYQTRHARNVIS